VENRAALLLHERGVDEDRLLEALTTVPAESEGTLRDLLERSREIARNCGSRETDCLHLLIGVTRVKCTAHDLLARVGPDLTSLRNTALSYQLSGRMPRKLQLGRTAAPSSPTPGAPAVPSNRPLGAPPSPLPSATKVAVVPAPAAPARPAVAPAPSIRE